MTLNLPIDSDHSYDFVGSNQYGIRQRQGSVRVFSLLILITSLGIQGCGNQASDSEIQSAVIQEEKPHPVVPPTVSIDVPPLKLDEIEVQKNSEQPVKKTPKTAMLQQDSATNTTSQPTENKTFEKGSVEWLLQDIARLQALSRASKGRKHQTNPLNKVIEHAQQVIVKTHDKPDQVEFFNSAVIALGNARLQLAVAGDQRQVQLLSSDAESLYKKDSKSFAAVESAFRVLQLTQLKAQSQAPQDSKWALAFARQARLFTNKFPNETNRAAIHLVAAGNICDKVGLVDEAKSCMLVVEEKFPNTPFADQVKNPLRRLRLPGQELVEFGGTTIDGNFISIEQFRGRPTIIAFWASNSIVFHEDMRLIQDVINSFGGGIEVIGVNLDKDEAAVQRFIGMNQNKWPHIFFSAPSKRGMENVIAKHYGVSIVPSYWLVDQKGIVQSINLKPQELRQWLGKLALQNKE